MQALTKLNLNTQIIACPCVNNMDNWRSPNALNFIIKGDKYHYGSKARNVKGIMNHSMHENQFPTTYFS